MRIEEIILYNLYSNEEYARKVLPFMEEPFFHEDSEQVIFRVIQNYINEYNDLPTPQAIAVEIENESLPEFLYDKTKKKFKEIEQAKSDYNQEWLVDRTEEFGKEKKVFNAMRDGIAIMQDSKEEKGRILDLLQSALAYSFDSRVGHSYIDDWELRFDEYHKEVPRIPFDIDLLNEVTYGGLPRKTLSAFMGGTNIGKSLVLCHMAAANLLAGYNVLYITAEMSEEMVSQRLDANIMDITMRDVVELPKDMFETKFDNKLLSKTPGRLVVKEYPTSTANMSHVRHLLHELQIKMDFVPDIVYFDYLNIFTSQRFKKGGTYEYYTFVSQEMRGLMVEYDMVGVTATQVNRTGFQSSDYDMDSISDSFGVPFILDGLWAIFQPDELAELGQYRIKQLKTRFGNRRDNRSFIVGVDTDRMKLYNVSDKAQENVTDFVIKNGSDTSGLNFGDLV